MGECAGREKLSSERGSGKMGRRGDGEAWRWGGVAMGRRGDGLVASGDEQQQQLQQQQLQQQQHEEGNATSCQAGPGIPIDPSRITRLSWQPSRGELSHPSFPSSFLTSLLSLLSVAHSSPSPPASPIPPLPSFDYARDKVARWTVAENELKNGVLSEMKSAQAPPSSHILSPHPPQLSQARDKVARSRKTRETRWLVAASESSKSVLSERSDLHELPPFSPHTPYIPTPPASPHPLHPHTPYIPTPPASPHPPHTLPASPASPQPPHPHTLHTPRTPSQARDKARDKVTRSSVADNEWGKSVLSEISSLPSHTLPLSQARDKDDVVKRIEERIAAWTFLPKGTFLNKFIYLSLSSSLSLCTSEHGEAIQILKYEIGQKYDAHFDYFFDAVNTQMGGHRVATVLMYLTTVEEGGETVFPSSQVCCWKERGLGVSAHRWAGTGQAPEGRCAALLFAAFGRHHGPVIIARQLSQLPLHAPLPLPPSPTVLPIPLPRLSHPPPVKPQKGDALLFYSLHPDGTTDQSSLHASCPVIRGEKWSATKWIHPSVRMIDGAALLPAQVLRNLSDKLYDKRKAAALEIETAVKAAVAEGNDERINAIISLLANDYATSAQPNQRKGGLIGLAAVTVGLGPDASQYLDVRLAAVTVGRFPDTIQYLDVRVVGGGGEREGRGVCAVLMHRIVPEVLKSFSDSDSRVRYYACEALYNIAKVTRGDFIVFFNDVFNALCKLSADLDPNVQSAAHLLDRLVKDIVTVSDQFSIEEFIPLLRAHMSVLNPFVQQFLVGWITVLDSVPDIDMLGFLPDLLDGLFNMLGDSAHEIRVQADSALREFLHEIRHAPAVEYGRMMEILVQRAGSSDEFTRLTAVTWINDFVKLGEAQMMPYYAAVVGAILPCIADREEKIAAIARDTNEEQLARVREQSVADGFDVRAVVEIARRELSSSWEATRLEALAWIATLLHRFPHQLLDLMDDPSTALLESLLAALADDSEQVVLEALSVQATVASHPHHFHRLLLLLLLRFNSDRALLDRRGSIIIRHLCAMLDADKVLRELAFILQNESDCQFAATIVPTLSLILLTAPELGPIRSKLRRSFAAAPAPAPAAAYEHAWSIVDALEESDLSLSLMVQMDKLVLLLETPIFSRLRLQLLDPSRSPALLKALYGLLMLLPQHGVAFRVLHTRLSTVPSPSMLHPTPPPTPSFPLYSTSSYLPHPAIPLTASFAPTTLPPHLSSAPASFSSKPSSRSSSPPPHSSLYGPLPHSHLLSSASASVLGSASQPISIPSHSSNAGTAAGMGSNQEERIGAGQSPSAASATPTATAAVPSIPSAGPAFPLAAAAMRSASFNAFLSPTASASAASTAASAAAAAAAAHAVHSNTADGSAISQTTSSQGAFSVAMGGFQGGGVGGGGGGGGGGVGGVGVGGTQFGLPGEEGPGMGGDDDGRLGSGVGRGGVSLSQHGGGGFFQPLQQE
ncbi:unnamed protein product [Closterium sp. Naga37s-1]|nr:unnamed protein product [Closterium sp. Naga37s-1]